ncbi:MAG TPA: hypothetical protein VFE05_07375 [Longimicrobiaceae bacterium]|jgi:hypothetical protein|nr:hypothetical protein [Longimicrobiaceae bacterium]
MLVEAKDVKFFEIAERGEPGEQRVHIEGLVFHSSFAVKRIDVEHTAHTAIVNVLLIPAERGLSGRFSVEVPLTGATEKILFGPSNVQIWPLAAT